MSWFPCCTDTSENLTCENCTGDFTDFTIVFTGFVDDGISGNAAIVNGTHILTPTRNYHTPSCQAQKWLDYGVKGWRYSGLGAVCYQKTYGHYIYVGIASNQIYVKVYVSCSQDGYGAVGEKPDLTEFSYSFTPTPACNSFSSVSCTNDGYTPTIYGASCGGVALDGTSATCTVTVA